MHAISIGIEAAGSRDAMGAARRTIEAAGYPVGDMAWDDEENGVAIAHIGGGAWDRLQQDGHIRMEHAGCIVQADMP